jgi:hypothetical protein
VETVRFSRCRRKKKEVGQCEEGFLGVFRDIQISEKPAICISSKDWSFIQKRAKYDFKA